MDIRANMMSESTVQETIHVTVDPVLDTVLDSMNPGEKCNGQEQVHSLGTNPVGINPPCRCLNPSFGKWWDSTEAMDMPPGSFGIEDPGNFDPFLEALSSDFELETYTIEGE
jgi:hypothetical protein